MSALPLQPQARPLRKWQAEALPLIREALAERAAGIIVACTGSGKSVTLAEVIAEQLDKLTGKIVVATSSTRLVNDLTRTIGARVGHHQVGRFFGEAKQADRRVIVTTYQSLGVLVALLEGQIDLLVADECHRTETEDNHRAITRAGGLRLGFTATPFRSHKDERLRLWDKVLVRYTPGDALRDGVICPWQVRQRKGTDIRPLDDIIIEMIKEHTEGPGAVNARSISDAVAFAARLCAEGIPAAAVHSGLSQHDQDARLRMLRDGDLRCVVYPSLLSEGADFPWLRWIGLRRKSGARVRFIQEVGRALRVSEGKRLAIILDPQDLFSLMSLTYTEVLGWQEDPERIEAQDEEEDDEEKAERDNSSPVMVSGVNRVVSWTRQLFLAGEAEGIASNKVQLNPSVRERIATDTQHRTLERFRTIAERTLPVEHAEVYKRLVAEQAVPSMGSASDLIELMIGLSRRERTTKDRWEPLLPVEAPSLEDLERLEVEMAGSWYTAGFTAYGMRVVAIVHGRRTVKAEVRSDDGVRGSNPKLAAAAAIMAANIAGDGAIIHVDNETARDLLNGDRRAWTDDLQTVLFQRPERCTYALVEEKDNPARKVAWAKLAARRKKAPSSGRAA